MGDAKRRKNEIDLLKSQCNKFDKRINIMFVKDDAKNPVTNIFVGGFDKSLRNNSINMDLVADILYKTSTNQHTLQNLMQTCMVYIHNVPAVYNYLLQSKDEVYMLMIGEPDCGKWKTEFRITDKDTWLGYTKIAEQFRDNSKQSIGNFENMEIFS